MNDRARPQLAPPDDPRFRGLPRGNGTRARFIVAAPTAEAALWAERLLEGRGYGFHRIGSARGAHGPNGNLWAFTWQVGGGSVPVWAGRLTDLTAGSPGACGPDGDVR
jgi:hypothetical protein